MCLEDGEEPWQYLSIFSDDRNNFIYLPCKKILRSVNDLTP